VWPVGEQFTQAVDGAVQIPPGFLEVGLRPQPAHQVVLRNRAGPAGQEILQDGHRLAAAAQGDDLVVTEHLEAAEKPDS
jgi:hypothetical protein